MVLLDRFSAGTVDGLQLPDIGWDIQTIDTFGPAGGTVGARRQVPLLRDTLVRYPRMFEVAVTGGVHIGPHQIGYVRLVGTSWQTLFAALARV